MSRSTAGCTRVGNLLGEGKPWEARVAALLGGGMQVGVCITLGAVVVYNMESWSGWFDLDDASVALMRSLLPLGVFYWFGIALGCGALRSVLTAMGLVRFAAIVQLVAFCKGKLITFSFFCFASGSSCLTDGLIGMVRFFFVSDPIGTFAGYLLAFGKLPNGTVPEWTSGITGLWIGCDLGYVFMIGALLIYYLRVDWQKMSRIAQESAAQDAKPPGTAAEEGQGEDGERAGLLGARLDG